VVAWLTGLSGAGKSTIADVVDRALTEAGRRTMVLDGDNLRQGLNRDLGFRAEDRVENIRRAAEAARLIADAGLVVILSLISPSRAERAAARAIAGDIPFVEVFIDTPLVVCEARAPMGLSERTRAGTIPNFTGISAPYEEPVAPDLALGTQSQTVTERAAAHRCADSPERGGAEPGSVKHRPVMAMGERERRTRHPKGIDRRKHPFRRTGRRKQPG
jgi:adenylyl-sulfate kinase